MTFKSCLLRLQTEAYKQRTEKSFITPLVSNCRMCMDSSLTGFYRVGQKLSDVIPVLRITPRATEPSTVSVFLSIVKCSRVCMAQTCAHTGIEPSRLDKGFPQGGPKSSKKFVSCQVNLLEQGDLLRQDEFTVWQGRRKCSRRVFLFEDLVLFSKTKKRASGADCYVYKSCFKVRLHRSSSSVSTVTVDCITLHCRLQRSLCIVYLSVCFCLSIYCSDRSVARLHCVSVCVLLSVYILQRSICSTTALCICPLSVLLSVYILQRSICSTTALCICLCASVCLYTAAIDL